LPFSLQVQLPRGKLTAGDKVAVSIGTRRISINVPEGRKGGEWIDVKIPPVSLPEGRQPGDPFAEFSRPLRCAAGPGKCCCRQTVGAEAGGMAVGSTTETCYYCVPTFEVATAAKEVQYVLHQPTCWRGYCVDPCAEGFCTCKKPFYLYKPDNDAPGEHVGKIIKVWSGLANEAFTDADTFVTHFPEDADAEARTTLVGATFLINQLYFE